MDTGRFFQEITLNICRSLDIAKGMQACLPVIKKAMPADEIMIHFYDPDLDGIRLIARAMEVLMAYDWPGNVRELKNIIERSLILNRSEDLVIDPLGPVSSAPKKPKPRPENLELDRVMARHIERVLNLTRGKIHGPAGAARFLA